MGQRPSSTNKNQISRPLDYQGNPAKNRGKAERNGKRQIVKALTISGSD